MALGDPCFGKTFDRLKGENEELRKVLCEGGNCQHWRLCKDPGCPHNESCDVCREIQSLRQSLRELRNTSVNRVFGMRVLFHRLWTMARDSPDYEKEPWKEMEKLLW
jgi:hypothetical protein